MKANINVSYKAGDEKINKDQEYSNSLHKYCDADYVIDIYDRLLVTSSVHLFIGTLVYWCKKNNLKPLEEVPIQKYENAHRRVSSKFDQKLF